MEGGRETRMRFCAACGQPILDKRPRSTGPRSQSAHLHGHLQMIAEHCGYNMGEMKAVMKEDCVGWPHKEVAWLGRTHMVPISEADATVEVESVAIDWCHVVAAELGIVLREEA